MNKTIDILRNHTSIRKFSDISITKEEEEEILRSAMQGATAGGMMQYSIIKIKDKDKLKELGVSCDNQPFIGNASMALLFLIDNHKFDLLFRSRKIPEKFENFSGPSVVDFMLGIQDAMIAAQNAVIAAESLDIGTCYIGDILEHFEKYREIYNLPSHVAPCTLVVFGRYDYKPKVRDRYPIENVVFDEKYPDIDENFIDSMYRKSEEKQPEYAEKTYARKMNADYYKEMVRSTKVIIDQWYKK